MSLIPSIGENLNSNIPGIQRKDFAYYPAGWLGPVHSMPLPKI